MLGREAVPRLLVQPWSWKNVFDCKVDDWLSDEEEGLSRMLYEDEDKMIMGLAAMSVVSNSS